MDREEIKKRAEAKVRREQARTQMYQDLVLECAERLFSKSGFGQVTMRDIAVEAAISPKTLYAVFPGKDEIYAEVARRRSLVLLDALRTAMAGDDSTIERMRRGLHALVRFLVEHRAFFHIMMRESRSWGLLPTGEASSSGDWRAGHRLQAELMQAGIDEGVFYDGDPELMAAISLSTTQVYLAAKLEGPGDPDSVAISEEIFDQVQRSLRKLPPLALEDSNAG
ncbi:MAG: TetR/AcrR family transcriptional regulator [Candidatus Binatia bacterium]|nr:TetR/AcrR family transcriptional regulator [Candidatus Binatia bacterium]